MSDTSQGPGWWQASDGKWYAPEQAPGATPPPPPRPLPPTAQQRPLPGQPPPSVGAPYPSGAWAGTAIPEQVSGLGRALQAIFIAWLVLGVLTIINLGVERSLLLDVQDDLFSVAFSDLEASDDRTAAIGGIFLIMLIGTIIVFLIWMNRAYKNLSFFGATTLRRTSGWSVGGWFIPFANLVLPYQAMRDIWLGSDPERTEYPHHWWDMGSTGKVVGWWWGLWLLSGVVGNFVFRNTADPGDIDAHLFRNGVDIFTEVVGLASAAAAYVLVKRVTERQQQRAARMNAAV